VKAEAWRAWQRSQHPRDITETETTAGGASMDMQTGTARPPGPRHQAKVRQEGQAGDPRFLAEIRHCLAEEVRLLGLAVPTHVTLDLERLSDAQLLALAQGTPPERVLAMAEA
jgi:hypothetical protein